MISHLTPKSVGGSVETDPTEDYYHTLMESPRRPAIVKAVYNLRNKRITATNCRGEHGVCFQRGYPENSGEPYQLRLLQGQPPQLEPWTGFNDCISRGDVPLDFSKLQIICKDEKALELLVGVVETKLNGCFVPSTEGSTRCIILGDQGSRVPLYLLSTFNQLALPFVQRKYDSTKAKFAPLKHPPKGLLYLELQNFHDKPEYAAHFELLEEFNFWTGALEKAKSNL
ncbi:MAG: hypothetical protein NTX24_01900 [Candidatus Pacearchaeota archaeon]|nr:hypothetical protein [Candidatus Pacearchaeota archaeon]